MRAALVWDPAFTAYRFRPNHPFNPKRLELAISLIHELELLEPEGLEIVPPREVLREELLTIHTPEYLDAVTRLSGPDAAASTRDADAWRWGLGSDDNPLFPGMHEVASRVVGGTLRAAELVMSGQVTRAFAIAGGLHHAHRDRASGFCVYSDLAVAIEWMRRAHGARVLYIDYDAHHGDGVQESSTATPTS